MKKTVAVGSVGGTISMTKEAAEAGVTPKLTAQDLVDSVPGLADVADIIAESLVTLPSGHLHFADVLACLDWANRQVEAGAAGVVLTQGTDSLEETAFLLDLLWAHEQPLVLTGAMRPPQKAGAEGPANLLAAVLAAAAGNTRHRGVLVVMNDWIHEARWVQKTHTSDVDAFQSQIGQAGLVFEGECRYFHAPSKRQVFAVPEETDNDIVIWESSLSEPEGALATLLQNYPCRGLVLSAFGAGHVTAEVAQRIPGYAAEMPVVVCSRTRRGSTAYQTYGYAGSETDLQSKGALMGGWLTPQKARLLLWVLIGNGLSGDALKQAFTKYSESLTY